MNGLYVDDFTGVHKDIPKGIRYDKDRNILVTSTQFMDEDTNIPDDQRTFKLLSNIANSIDRDLQFTFDVPSLNPNNRVPIMDLESWIDLSIPEYPHGKILFSHYVKPRASNLVLQKESAMSMSMLRTILTQEGIRVLLNCHPDLPPEEVGHKMTGLMQKLRNAGWGERFRK